MLLNPLFYDNTRIQGFPTLEQTNGPFESSFAPLKMTVLEGDISGPIADLQLTQIFAFEMDEIVKSSPIEAIYRFPLPGDAAISEVSVKFGEVEIRTHLLPRKKAEKEYEIAKKNNQQAVLLTRESPDVFTLSVNGILPGEEVKICTRFVQAGSPFRTGFSFRIPLTSAPRYVRSDEQHTRHAQGNPLFTVQDPLHRFRIRLKTVGLGTLESTTHQISREDGQYVLSSGEVIPNKDFEILYRPEANRDEMSCQVYSSGGDEPCLLALVTPPLEKTARVPLDVIILLDHSGSMNGGKKSAADRAVKHFLNRLSPEDRFNLCLFESNQYWLADNPVPPTVENLNIAMKFIDDTRSGGTDLGVAIEQALFQSRTSGTVSRHLLIITDAAVSDFGRITSLIEEESERTDKRRCSVVCIDSSPNVLLARSISEKTGGVSLYLKNDSQREDIADTIDEIFSAWQHIISDGVFLSVNRTNVLSKGRVRSTPNGNSLIDIPPVGVSRSSWIMAKASPGPDPLICSLSLPDGREITATAYDSPAVRSLVGAWIIQELEYLMHSGLTEDSIHKKFMQLGIEKPSIVPVTQSTVYAENSSTYLAKNLTQVIEQISLEYGIISSETAFYASREERGKPTETLVVVSSALPEGWSDDFDMNTRIHACLTADREYARPHVAQIAPSSYTSGVRNFFPSGPDISKMIARDTFRSDKKLEVKPQGISNRIIVFQGVPIFHEHRAELYNSDIITEELEQIRKGKVIGLRMRISGVDYDKSQALSMIIEIYGGLHSAPIESLTVREFMRCGAYSWPDPDLIKDRPIRLVLYDPKGVCANWAVLLEVEIQYISA